MSKLVSWAEKEIQLACKNEMDGCESGEDASYGIACYKSALKETSSVLLDTDALRADIGRVKGIGDKRLDEIMSIIEIHLIKSGKTE